MARLALGSSRRPSLARSRRRGKPGASAEELQEMWRALLAERMKLAAHYEAKERGGYNLIRSRPDGALGAGLKPSTLACSQPATRQAWRVRGGVAGDVARIARGAHETRGALRGEGARWLQPDSFAPGWRAWRWAQAVDPRLLAAGDAASLARPRRSCRRCGAHCSRSA